MGKHPGISVDLVSAFYLLLCCMAFCYHSARENPAWTNAMFEGPDGILRTLCRRHIIGADDVPGDAVQKRASMANDLCDPIPSPRTFAA